MSKREKNRGWSERDWPYQKFPGVAECARLIRNGCHGMQSEAMVHELAAHARDHLSEMIATFRSDPHERVKLFMLMALDYARLPESVPFLAKVLKHSNTDFSKWAQITLRGIGTREARTAI